MCGVMWVSVLRYWDIGIVFLCVMFVCVVCFVFGCGVCGLCESKFVVVYVWMVLK